MKMKNKSVYRVTLEAKTDFGFESMEKGFEGVMKGLDLFHSQFKSRRIKVEKVIYDPNEK